jgi:POT family proton-dependent oligopeptide transporter
MSSYRTAPWPSHQAPPGIPFIIDSEDGSSKPAGADYDWFFTLMMLCTAVLFTLVAQFYKGQSYIHEEVPEALAGRDIGHSQ